MRAVTTEQIRRIDFTAIHELHIPSLLLMENAAGKTAEAVETLLAGKEHPRVLVACGTGNNGGDVPCLRKAPAGARLCRVNGSGWQS